MTADDSYQAIKRAIRNAGEEARKCVDEALEAADPANAAQGGITLEIFDARAARALAACERWQDWFANLRDHVAKDRHR